MSAEERHPSPQELEAAALGWLPDAGAVRAHAARCPRCRSLLADEEELLRLLATSRRHEPRVDVVDQVLARIERLDQARAAPFRRSVLGLIAASFVFLVAVLLVLLTPNAMQAAGRWLSGIVIREVPAPGQQGAPPERTTTPASGGGPIREVGLDEARRLAPFPVALPASPPEGFALASVTVFQADPGAAPTQVFVRYQRAGAYQPLVITYQAPRAGGEVRAAPGTVREMVVGRHRAVYVDAVSEGARPASGTGPVAEIGRLVVERPDVVLTLSGDRRDGLDAATLAAVAMAIPAP
jgi:hypothetical protein